MRITESMIEDYVQLASGRWVRVDRLTSTKSASTELLIREGLVRAEKKAIEEEKK